jgi:peptide deformylase
MAVMEIKKYPERILKEKAATIENIDAVLHQLVDDMIETMHYAGGIGLAANQIGVARRVCVLDLARKEEKMPLIVLVNPVITEKEGSVDAEEGCLSIPGYMTSIKRAEKILVKGVNREGKDIELEAEGLLARALQHEIDHLEGLLFIDRMSPIRREFFKRRYKKLLKEKNDK